MLDKKKLSWCLKQKKGIILIEPNSETAKAYMQAADKDIAQMFKSIGKWKIIAAYYACYESLYSLLQKIGIKSEIHGCTLILMDLFSFSKSQKKFIKDLKKEREKVQYYLIKPKKIDEQEVKQFVLTCKTIFQEITEEEIKEIRKILEEVKR